MFSALSEFLPTKTRNRCIRFFNVISEACYFAVAHPVQTITLGLAAQSAVTMASYTTPSDVFPEASITKGLLKSTTEFQVNSYPINNQPFPAVAALMNAGFVVAWYGLSPDGGLDIYARQYNAVGVPGTEFQVSSNTTYDQVLPAAAALADGGFIVTWNSWAAGGGYRQGLGIYARQYDVVGIPGPEFQVNSHTMSDQANPTVAGLKNGGFVVTWSNNGAYGNGLEIYARQYNAVGVPGTEFQVNSYTANWQYRPSVAALTDGGFVVTWISDGQDGSGLGVYARQYNAAGVPGPEFQVNSYTTNHQANPSIAALTNGGFVVTWHSTGQDGSGEGIYGRQYSVTAVPGKEFQVNTCIAGDQWSSSVAGLIEGSFIVTWGSDGNCNEGEGWDIYGRQYNAAGVPETEFQINKRYTANDQWFPLVSSFSNGGFVVIWISNNEGESTYNIDGYFYDALSATATVTPSVLPTPSKMLLFSPSLAASETPQESVSSTSSFNTPSISPTPSKTLLFGPSLAASKTPNENQCNMICQIGVATVSGVASTFVGGLMLMFFRKRCNKSRDERMKNRVHVITL